MDRSSNRKADTVHVEFDSEGPVVDAELIADLLNIPADQVSYQIRQGTITTLCEAGIDEHEGGYRLSFFHRNRCAQIEVDCEGQVSNRTVINFGDRPLPASLHRPGLTQASKTKGNRSGGPAR